MDKKYLIYEPLGRLGNGLFRYLASVVYCIKYDMTFIHVDDFRSLPSPPQNITFIQDHNYIDFLTNNERCDNHIFLGGYFQFDYIYEKYRNDILEYIDKNRDHFISERYFEGLSPDKGRVNVYDFVNTQTDKIYDYVIHLRLGDYIEQNNPDCISFEETEKLLNSLSITKDSKNAIVVDLAKNEKEQNIVKQYIDWFENEGLSVVTESNDYKEDFAIMKNCKNLICSMSSFSWISAYFSKNINTCFMPNYHHFKTRTFQYFKNPIKNTIHYDTNKTDQKLARTKAIIISLEKYPERLDKLTKFITQMNMIGLHVDIFYGVNGNEIDMKDIDGDVKKLLFYRGGMKFYDPRVRINGELMKKGEFGAAWSHIKLYEKLLHDKNYENYLIFEDDVDMIYETSHTYNVLDNIPEKFDLLHLSFSDFFPFIMTQRYNDYFNIPMKRYFNRATGYMVSKCGAEKLLSFSNDSLNIPADDILSMCYINSDLQMYVPGVFIFKDQGVVSVIGQVNQ